MTTTKQPQERGGFAATLKADRLSGFDPDKMLDQTKYYTIQMMASIDPAWRRRLVDHLLAKSAYERSRV